MKTEEGRNWVARHKALTGFLVVLAIIVIAASSGDGKSNNAGNGQGQEQAAAAPAVEVTARQLVADYDKNEIAADTKYKGHTLEVTGTVQSVGKDFLDVPYVSLASDNAIFGVQCYLNQDDAATVEEASKLTKGAKVTMRGEDVSKLGNVMLKNCVFLSK